MDFFVTYDAADQRWAEWVAERLRASGFSVELQSWDYWARSSLILEMFAVSGIAETTIALLSPDYLANCLTRPEWSAAYAQDPTASLGILLPVLVRDCYVSDLVPEDRVIDLAGLDDEAAAEKLLGEVSNFCQRKTERQG